MSIQAMTWVLDHSEAVGSERLVLLSLANHAHADGSHAFPSAGTIRREARLRSKRTVLYALQALEHGGAIRRTGVGPNRAVEYRINMGEDGLAYRTATHKETVQREKRAKGGLETDGATVAPPPKSASEGATVAPSTVQPTTAEGATSARVTIKPSENRPLTVTPDPSRAAERTAPPRPPSGERPEKPVTERKRDLRAYEQALAAWAPCPGDDVDPLFVDSWQRALGECRATVGESTYHLWLRTVHVHGLTDDGTLIVGADPDRATYMGDRYGRLVIAAAQSVGIDAIALDVVACDQLVQVECLHPDHHPHQAQPHQEGSTDHERHAGP